MHHVGRIPSAQQRIEFRTQPGCWFEPAVRLEVLGERTIERTRDMPGNRVQRFHLTAISRGATRIDKRLRRVIQSRHDSGLIDQRDQRFPKNEIRLERRRFVMVGDVAANHTRGRFGGDLPGLQAPVEHRDRVVADPLQHPPQATAKVGAVAVIDHCLHVIGKAHAR